MNAHSLVDVFSRGTKVLLFVLAVSIATGVRPSVAAADLEHQMQFDIPPQQLSSALLKFSAQSDIQVTVPGQLVEGKNSPGVVGKYKPGSALACDQPPPFSCVRKTCGSSSELMYVGSQYFS